MKLKLSLQNVTTSKGKDQRKKNGNALVHNFVALSACAALAMILAIGSKVSESGGEARYMQLRIQRRNQHLPELIRGRSVTPCLQELLVWLPVLLTVRQLGLR